MIHMSFYRHLLVRGLGRTPKNFGAKRGGGSLKTRAVDDRDKHARILASELSSATKDIDDVIYEQKEFSVPAAKRGMVLTIEGRPNVDLRPGNRRPTSPGLKMYTLQRGTNDGDEDFQVDRATFFVTPKVVETLTSDLEQYRQYEEPVVDELEALLNDDEEDPRRPRNFWLFESASAIRRASLRDFWTDNLERFPTRNANFAWEVWVRKDLEQEFLKAASSLNLAMEPTSTEFVETSVRSVRATPGEMARLVTMTPALVELQSASTLDPNFLNSPFARTAVDFSSLAARLVAPPADATRIALLDTGVNRQHPMLNTSLWKNRCFAAHKSWGVSDHSDHGTRMAGVAQFYDLAHHLTTTGPIEIYTRLESVVVSAPPGGQKIPARAAVTEAVRKLEEEPASRVFCLAQTARGEANNGRVSATSAVVDLLAYGKGTAPRLFCVAAGNVPTSDQNLYQVQDYDTRNSRFGIEAPAQAANAITVGAMTLKTSKNGLVAPFGDMAPTSRSAEEWNADHPTKPDIVMEGGNFAVQSNSVYAEPSSSDLILTTSGTSATSLVALTGETSAATARAAGLLARMKRYYPELSQQSLRGLLIHSAEWTPAMLHQQRQLVQSGRSVAEAWEITLGRYGWGTPDEAKAYYSSENAFTMIIEDQIKPFEKKPNGTTIRIREMKYFKLPWPKQVLRQLGSTEIEMKCTLSYFLEPDPQAVSRDRYERYKSFGLKFDVKRYDESDESAESAFNGNMYAARPSGDNGWTVGPRLASRGTLQQDIWRGPAWQLLDRDGISVGVVKGWWADIVKADRYNLGVPYSLIVSLKAPSGNDLMAEVARNAAKVLVNQPVLVQA